MANGTIAFDTLTTSDSVNTGTEKSIDTSYIFNGVNKVWFTLGMDAVQDDSFNQSSASDEGTGTYDFNFTNAFSSRDRTILGTCNKGENTSRPYLVQELNTPPT